MADRRRSGETVYAADSKSAARKGLRVQVSSPALITRPEGGAMSGQLIARASVEIAAPLAKVWDALVNPEVIKRYMFGATVISDWKVGSPIVWKGEWKGKAYEDRGVILRWERERLLSYSHFSPLSGLPDVPENYHTVTIVLSSAGGVIRLELAQDKNPSEEARAHSEQNWLMALEGLKRVVEG